MKNVNVKICKTMIAVSTTKMCYVTKTHRVVSSALKVKLINDILLEKMEKYTRKKNIHRYQWKQNQT